jgi:hypothetical protein
VADKIRTQAECFERNADRKRYTGFFRSASLVGSTVIEADLKTVVGSRLRQSGLFWTVWGASAITAMRCRPFEDYWGARRPAA